MIPVEGQKVVNLSPDWVAGYFRIRWQLSSGLGGSFRPEYATLSLTLKSVMVNQPFEEHVSWFGRY